MRRDFDLVVTILSELRDAEAASLGRADIETAIQTSMPDTPSAAVIAHHLEILADAGLIAQVAARDGSLDNGAWRLTWNGHDALDQQEDDEGEDD
ncbi:DUF2513 domain-containing protein [Bordetella petrii]|uniref:DUF2513 domain-containing protein n=1 Tax=Bordetella petrii TaxID=94624 RepID=UPI001E44064F|nr:DUF2513 domain-containing protein [Bordetella petrii]MCD0502608.1 DUF2513 domain-containing protein [Bordetella petrii]